MKKVKAFHLKGLRGFKELQSFNLNEQSILLYGDNGTGKSSIADSFEWFLYDQIDHLSNEEIGKKGTKALRNIFISDNENSYMELELNEEFIFSKKFIDKVSKSSYSNNSDLFSEYVKTTKSENLILRHRDLVQFVTASKSEKLAELQKIIGFADVASMRILLNRIPGRIARNIKATNYDNLRNVQQSSIIEHLGQNAHTEEIFFKGANDLIKPLQLGLQIQSGEDVNNVLLEIKSKEDTAIVEQIASYTRIWTGLLEFTGDTAKIFESYNELCILMTDIKSDPENIEKLKLLALYKEGLSVLINDVTKDDFCPLCQQNKSKLSLIEELNQRIDSLEKLEKQKSAADSIIEQLDRMLNNNLSKIDRLLNESILSNSENELLKKGCKDILGWLNEIKKEIKRDNLLDLKESNELKPDNDAFSSFASKAQSSLSILKESQSKNLRLDIYTSLLQASNAFVEYKRLTKEQHVLAQQQNTFELIYEDFIKRQEESLNSFLNLFSQNINNYYSIMNPNEKVEEIKLVPLMKSDELVGITIEYSFYDKTRTQPIAYLSESHINCLGLAFFLASVKAFNRENKFIVLDDVISSFDREHRTRFAKLLTTEFEDFQILLFTHEKEFYEDVAKDLKAHNWIAQKLSWAMENGTTVEN